MKVNGKTVASEKTVIHEITHTCGHHVKYTPEKYFDLFNDIRSPDKRECQDCRKKEALKWLRGFDKGDDEIKPGEIKVKTEIKQKGGTYHFRITHEKEPPKTLNQALENFRLAVDELKEKLINLVLKILRRR